MNDKLEATKIAEQYAASQGKTLPEIIEPIKAGLNSRDGVAKNLAVKEGRKVVAQLTQLLLRQELYTNKTHDYITKFVDMFDNGVVNEGNGKVYDFNNTMGVDTWNADIFIPDAFTSEDVDEFKITMYQSNGQLTTQGYQFKKPIVYQEKRWIPYFRAGNLSAFIQQLAASIDRAYYWYMYDKIARLITDNSKRPGKVINGTATNAFDAWSTEILPEIRKMTRLSKDYNYNQSNTNLLATEPKDLLVFASSKTIQTLQSGIKSQLFNVQFLDIKGLVDAENFINLGKKLTLGTTSQKVTTENEEYVNDNTVIVIAKDAIKHFSQVDTVETQFFAENLSTLIVKHKWGAIDWLPWSQAFVYTNANLNTLP